MSMTPEEMQNVLIRYFEAWQNQDTQSLLNLFDENGVYRVKPFGIEEYHGKKEIQEYWQSHPVNGQSNPRPKLIKAAFGDDICFAEWENSFINNAGKHKQTRGMLLLEFTNGLIKELREHYLSIESD